MKTLLERFEEKYTLEPNTGCWIWGAATDPAGYGMLWDSTRLVGAHRISYEIHVGPIGDKYVLHKCDTPACVNPAHLFLGTCADNMADRDAKGRQARGEKHGRSKLTADEVIAIRADPRKKVEIAADYGVTDMAIHYIKTRQVWAHIGDDDGTEERTRTATG